MVENHSIQRKFTVNGTFIPQDSTGNDMCILFMKYGRCRFKSKCKKSHWVPPLPDEPYPFQCKPPLPNDDQIDKEKASSSENDSFNTGIDLTGIINKSCPKSTPLKNLDAEIYPDVTKLTKTYMFPRRFKHVFQDYFNDPISDYQYSTVNRLFNEVGAYFDNVTQKIQIPHPPRNKIEKHHLKILRRINWRNTQTLKEKLSQYPPSYNLKFDKSKIDFTRLRPYIYVLIHECIFVDGEKKPVKPSSFEYLVADTLLAYLESKCITAQEAEEKLQQWGARPVRARQCIAHLWHILAISSKSPCGCAEEVAIIEKDVVDGSRTSLDFACASAFALKRVKPEAMMRENSDLRGKVSIPIKPGLETKRVRNSKHYVKSLRGSFTRRENQNEIKCRKKFVRKKPERRNETAKHARILIHHAQTLIKHSENAGAVNLCTEQRTGHVEKEIEHAGKETEHARKETEHARKETEHARKETKQARKETEHARKETGYVEKVTEHADEHSKDRGDNCFRKTEDAMLNVEGITKCAKEDTKHAQEKVAHVTCPAAHAKLREINARSQTEKASDKLKDNLFKSKSIHKKRQRSKQFRNVPFNERMKFKERCVQLLSTS